MDAQVVDLIEGRRSGALVKHTLQNRDRFATQAATIGSSASLQLPVNVLGKIFDQQSSHGSKRITKSILTTPTQGGIDDARTNLD